MRKEIPILYSTFMAQAKIAKRKTQTRRIVKLKQKGWKLSYEANEPNRRDLDAFGVLDKYGNYVEIEEGTPGTLRELNLCPYGQPGDLLWGRESVTIIGSNIVRGGEGEILQDDPIWCYKGIKQPHIEKLYKWKPSIHMPKEAARIWDEVTGIRVERIADISEEDCIAEGIERHVPVPGDGPTLYKNYLSTDGGVFYNPIESFRSLWQLINGKPKPIQSKQNGKLVTIGYEVYPFDKEAAKEFAGLTTWRGKPLSVIANPWVWVIESKQLSVTGKPAVPAAGKE